MWTCETASYVPIPIWDWHDYYSPAYSNQGNLKCRFKLFIRSWYTNIIKKLLKVQNTDHMDPPELISQARKIKTVKWCIDLVNGISSPQYLPYSSTSMSSISLIGSSTERSARDGRFNIKLVLVSSFGTSMSPMYFRSMSSGIIFLSSHNLKTYKARQPSDPLFRKREVGISNNVQYFKALAPVFTSTSSRWSSSTEKTRQCRLNSGNIWSPGNSWTFQNSKDNFLGKYSSKAGLV